MSKHEVSSSTGPIYTSKVAEKFIGMGFSKKMVDRAIKENGEDDIEVILQALLTYPDDEKPYSESKRFSTETCCNTSENHILYFSDDDTSRSSKENRVNLSDKDVRLALLVDMGYDAEEVSVAIDKLGQVAEMTELIDYICAARFEKELADHDDEPTSHDHWESKNDYFSHVEKKIKFYNTENQKQESSKGYYYNKAKEKKPLMDDEDDLVLHLPNPMIGFGIPGNQRSTFERTLPDSAAAAPPYFYYENVACTPKGVWTKISRFLYEVGPEFVDSVHFSAAARKRGYIHNLPITNRIPLLPTPPLTVQEAFPLMKKWWPKWDKRTKLNCIQTKFAPATVTEKIRSELERCGGSNCEPPPSVKKLVLEQCRRWNLVWVGKNRVAPLDPDEVEFLLGFPKGHTRGGGISVSDRYTALGNSFQVDTVAYHLSVLKRLFPAGINVLSLFSGIGGAEVALHRLGVRLNNVVSVEISEMSRNILRSWWEQTNQQGNLVEVSDVTQVTAAIIEHWISIFGGFDLVIGGSPCNNLAGANRVSRDGLEGKHSSLFFDYFRVLRDVKSIMAEVT